MPDPETMGAMAGIARSSPSFWMVSDGFPAQGARVRTITSTSHCAAKATTQHEKAKARGGARRVSVGWEYHAALPVDIGIH